MDEPSMLLQRPSTSQSQETSHILKSTFRDLFTHDDMNEHLIENLKISKSGDDVYHDKYVDKLQAVRGN